MNRKQERKYIENIKKYVGLMDQVEDKISKRFRYRLENAIEDVIEDTENNLKLTKT